MDKEYLTVKEFSAAANISQQAVYKQIYGRLEPFVKVIGNQKLIEAEALKKFYSKEDPDDSTAAEPVEQPDSTGFQPDSTEHPLPNQPKEGGVEQLESTEIQPDARQKELEDQIKELQEQIKEILKNDQEEKKFLRDQIIQKDKQIESLTDNLKIAQQLAAADKKKLLELEEKQKEIVVEETDLQKSNIEAEEKTPKKKGFFSWLFG